MSNHQNGEHQPPLTDEPNTDHTELPADGTASSFDQLDLQEPLNEVAVQSQMKCQIEGEESKEKVEDLLQQQITEINEAEVAQMFPDADIQNQKPESLIESSAQTDHQSDEIDLEDIQVEGLQQLDQQIEDIANSQVIVNEESTIDQSLQGENFENAIQESEKQNVSQNEPEDEDEKFEETVHHQLEETEELKDQHEISSPSININDREFFEREEVAPNESFIGDPPSQTSSEPLQLEPNLNFEQLQQLQEKVEHMNDLLSKKSLQQQQLQDSSLQDQEFIPVQDFEEDQQQKLRDETLRQEKVAMKKQMLEALFGKVDKLAQENSSDKMRRYQRNGNGSSNGGSQEPDNKDQRDAKIQDNREPMRDESYEEEQDLSTDKEPELTEEQLKEEIAKEQERLRKEKFQREKDALRAPFLDLMNSNQEKKERQEQLAAAQAANLRYKDTSKNRPMHEISKVITVDSFVLNYGTFMPGKLLGSTLSVVNESSFEQIVELSIDAASFNYNKKVISEKYDVTDIPFSFEVANPSAAKKKDGSSQGQQTGNNSTENIVNSEFKHECWYIENPISRELTKRITLKLGPKAEQEFIVVLRCPSNNVRRLENLLSIINIGLLTYADEEFGARDSFDDLLKIRYGGSMKEFLRERKKLAGIQKLEVLLAGRVEVPGPLTCPRELLMSEYNNEKVVSIVVKKGPQSGTGAQKFRLPFKNMGNQEIEVVFNFAQQSAVICGPQPLPNLQKDKGSGSSSNGSADHKKEGDNQPPQLTSSPIELSVVPPSTMKVPPNGGSIIINLAAKLKNSYQLQALKESKHITTATNLGINVPPRRPEKYTHLLTARVKDTQIVFSFIIEVAVIEASGSAAMS